LDFKNSEILLADHVLKAEKHRLAKLHQNWSIRCGDITTFRFVKMAAGVVLNF